MSTTMHNIGRTTQVKVGDTLSSGLRKRQGILGSCIFTMHSMWGHDSSQVVSHWRAAVGCFEECVAYVTRQGILGHTFNTITWG